MLLVGATLIASLWTVAGTAGAAGAAANAPLTPGLLSKRVTQQTVESTICSPGWIRRRGISERAKHEVFREYGLARGVTAGYVVTHLIPVELGGADALHNLYPELKGTVRTRKAQTALLRDAVCRGQVSLADAQARFAANGSPAVLSPTTRGASVSRLPGRHLGRRPNPRLGRARKGNHARLGTVG